MSTVKEDVVLRRWCHTDESKVYEDVDPNGPPMMAAEKNLAWQVGTVINVRFLDGDAPINALIAKVAKEWEKYANITFNFVDDKVPVKSSDIRIKKTKDDGHWSMLGTNRSWTDNNGKVHTLGLDEATMNLDPIDVNPQKMGKGQYGYGTVLHEFGHAIGLVHEHLRPDRPIKFKSNDDLYRFYKSDQGWSEDDVNFNVINVAKGVVGTLKFDFNSIMMYSFPEQVLASNDPKLKEVVGKAVLPYPVNNDLSADDKSWIQLLYPKKGDRGSLQEVKPRL
ncbi:uncharacterized protein PV09_08182 [Verruconis gallopava]|uniref:Peptidase metallopeptidase domain-containing protein n=1 Tax=Verruconis gallopava TaxID=253628 RepID=A0A0D1YHG8_9PEZI|nr:uncharacterized protein PV09_08182 [Verruconis gallopava]KIW00292.1 hypothetical protein PV09_08182 [Verruconis gallopava]